MMNRRRLLVTAAFLALLVGTSFAVPRATTLAASHSANHARALTKVKFILNWLPNVEFAGLWVAQQKGWWKQAGIDMTYEGWTPAVAPERDVPEAGGNTFGFQSGAALVIARSKNIPDVAVYTDTQRTVFGLTVLAKSKIYKLSQLKGKKVGFQPHELYVPETMLSCVGLQAGRDYKTVPVSFDISQLTSGAVDAYLTFLTNEPIALALQGVKTRSFAASNYCFHFYDDVMFTTNGLIKSNPSLVRTVTGIVARGFQWAHEHPVQAAQITVHGPFPAGAAGKGVTATANALQQKIELQTFSRFSANPQGKFLGLMNASTWRDSINILARFNQISTKPSASSMFTNQFNPYR